MPEITPEIMAQCRDDPVLFGAWLCGYPELEEGVGHNFSYEHGFLRDPSRRISVVSAKRVGKTTSAGIKGAHFACVNEDVQVLVLAPTREQSRLVYKVIRKCFTQPILAAMIEGRPSKTEFHLINGSIIYCKPAWRDASTVQGFSADMMIYDEAGLVTDESFDATWMFTGDSEYDIMILISTPYGTQGRFFKIHTGVQEDEPEGYGWSRYEWRPSSINPIIAEKMPGYLENVKRSYGSQWAIEQFFYARFIASIGAVFPFEETIKPNLLNYEKITHGLPGARYVMGIDYGYQNDNSVIIVLELGRPMRLVYIKQFPTKTNYKEVNKTAIYLAKRFNMVRITADMIGQGFYPVQDLQKQLGEQKVIGLAWNNKIKVNTIINGVRASLERKELIIPAGTWGAELRHEMQQFRFEQDPISKHMKFMTIGHDDHVTALGYAFYSAGEYQPMAPYVYVKPEFPRQLK